jgi:23S rRNA pseudouridine1911/1915/1917 synthase
MQVERNAVDMPADGPPSENTWGELRMLLEDAHLLAVEKPAGQVTHPAYKHPDGTLADAVFAWQAGRGEGRPWLLHRLDRETSGVVLFAKTEQARRGLVRQFERRTVQKRYLALVVGTLAQAAGQIEAPLARDPVDRRRTIVVEGGQPATTRYRVLAARGSYALVLAEPITGRTHQIRAHLAWLGAPIAGDARYLDEAHPVAPLASHALLHAWRIGFRHPASGEPVAICAPLPADFAAAIRTLGLEHALSGLEAGKLEDEP